MLMNVNSKFIRLRVVGVEKQFVLINLNDCLWTSLCSMQGPCAVLYSVILSVLDPRKCEYLKDYSLDFEHAYMTTYLAS